MRLKCFILVEIKTKDIDHGDLGQIQLYVNYFDKKLRYDGDNSTIGLVLCTGKNDAMVKYLLGEGNSQIFASKYQLYLPTIEELEKEIKREIKFLMTNTKKR